MLAYQEGPDLLKHAMRSPDFSQCGMARGFTLLELIMAVSVFAILAGIAVPQFYVWTQSAQIRSVTESLQNDIRLAQGEAIRQNRQVQFSLTNGIATPNGTAPIAAANGSNWMAYTVALSTNGESPVYVAGGSNNNTSPNIAITGPATITFSPFGRLLNVSQTQQYQISTKQSVGRSLVVNVYLGGQVRMCDPTRTVATSPDGC